MEAFAKMCGNDSNDQCRNDYSLYIFSGSFIITWLPYAIFVSIGIAGFSHIVPPTLQTLPSMLAKASVLWNPIIYASRCRTLKRGILETFPCLSIFNTRKAVSRTPITQMSLTRQRHDASSLTNGIETSRGELVSIDLQDDISTHKTTAL